ncbi:PHP domain-containing protein [bacterium]|nr:PHP domain-containing protein [bacterium]
MKDLKELIKNFTKEDYECGNVNLHIHTKYSDGLADFCDIAKQAQNKTIAITDHNTVQGYIDNPNLNIITGVEFDVWYKYIFLHLLAYGIDVHAECLQKFYAKDKRGTEKDIVRIFSKRNIIELINSIHKAGGIAVIAHPACCWALNMDKFIQDLKNIGLDGIEVYYPYPRWRKYMRFASVEKIEKIADKYNLIKTGGTDCHCTSL